MTVWLAGVKHKVTSLPTLQSPVTQIPTSGVDTDRDNVDTDVVMRL